MERFLKSRYKIGAQIGENPFSVTYKGYLIGSEVPVVIKIYKRAALNSPLINKLRPKVVKMINIDHPFIAKILDGDYGWQGFYFVREFVDGEPLDRVLGGKPLEIDTALETAKRIIAAMKFAHDNGIIHGALGANNVFVSRKKELKIVDFIMEGSVRSNIDLLAQKMSQDARYLSPEQIKGETVTNYSDIYSFGAIFYQLVTGDLPFNGAGNLDIAMKHLKERPVEPSSLNPNIPSYLDDIILKALEKDPVMRFRKFDEIQDSLRERTLVFKGADVDLSNLIYDDVETIAADEAPERQEPKKIKTASGKRSGKYLWAVFMILIAIASGLWYSFIQGLINMR